MKITAESLLLDEMIRNRLSLKRTDGYAVPIRFTNKQLAMYASLPGNFQANSLCTAGVCLDLVTNSGFIRMKSVCKTLMKAPALFDLYVNGYYVDSRPHDGPVGEPGEVFFLLPGREARITVYFPHDSTVCIGQIELEDGCIFKATAPCDQNYLCLGGSISQGMSTRRPSSMYAIQLARALNMNLLNQGVSGYYYEAESLDEQLPYRPDLITVAYGGNEGKICATIQEFADRCSAYMTKLATLFPSARIFVIPPTWRKSYYSPMRLGTYQDIAASVAEVCRPMANVTVFDGLKLLPHMEHFYADGLHPTDEGFLHFTVNMLPVILRSLR